MLSVPARVLPAGWAGHSVPSFAIDDSHTARLSDDLFAAGGAACIFKKLGRPAAFVAAADQEPLSALLTAFLHEGGFSAERAGDIKRAPAARTKGLPLLDGAQAAGTQIAERAPAAAG